jgi:hypothetical protein
MMTSITDRSLWAKKPSHLRDQETEACFDPDRLLFHESFRGDMGKRGEWSCLGIGPFRMGSRVLPWLSGCDGLMLYKE